MSTTPTLRDAAQASPCPFCGGDSTAPSHSQHRPGCYFLVLASVKAAPQGDVSWAPDLLAAWNRRAALTQGAGEAVEPVATFVERADGRPVATAVWLNSMPNPDWDLEMLDSAYPQFAPHRLVDLVRAQQLQQAVARALEELKFHPQASHVEPNYRDWFNRTIDAALRERNP